MVSDKNKLTFSIIFLINISTWGSVIIFGPLSIEIARDLSIQVGTVGIIHSFFLLVSGVLSFLWAYLENKYSRKQLLLVAVIIHILGFLLSIVAPSFWVLLTARIITAIGFGAFLPLTYSIAIDLKPAEERAKVFASIGLSIFVGFGLGNILGGSLIGLISWRIIFLIIIIFLLSSSILILFIKVPKKGSSEQSLESLFTSGKGYYSYRLNRKGFLQLLRIKTNLFMIIFFFVHDFTIGTVSFYMITMLRSDLQLSAFNSLILMFIAFIPQVAGISVGGKYADKQFSKRPNGRISTLFFIVLIGPMFSIIAYAVMKINLILFMICLMIFSFTTASIISIGNSILGDINPPELRSTVFSLSNFSGLCGRCVGIAICGTLYNNMYFQYGDIFLIFQVIILILLPVILIIPKDLIPKEIKSLENLLRSRAAILANEKIPELVKKPKTIYTVINSLIDNQMKVAQKLKDITKNQIYLTKMVYYSLEVMKRILKQSGLKNDKVEEVEYSPLGTQKIDELLEF